MTALRRIEVMAMKMLSDDDLNLEGMSDEELAAAWDLWFDLAQATNDDDPPYTHGVFQLVDWDAIDAAIAADKAAEPTSDDRRPGGPAAAVARDSVVEATSDDRRPEGPAAP